MCGIAGVLDNTDDARRMLERMLHGVAHRGPDSAGMWVDGNERVALGHRRLSIIDTSPAGHQPMASPSGRYRVTYNGEIYNYRELREELDASGRAPAWAGHSDTEVLLAGFDAWGIAETLRRSNGMFALAVWDGVDRTLTLARDRMGEKPLYFGRIESRFCFASEIKALLGATTVAPCMAPSAIARFLGYGYIGGLQSAIDGVLRLPAGCMLTFSHADAANAADPEWVSTRIVRYWSLADAARAGLRATQEPDIEALHGLLEDAVSKRMIADVPIGAFLSGGIDSSLIVALMQRASARRVETFSIGFHERAFDEAPYARAIADALGTSHHELYVDADDALALVPTLARRFDEPFADPSQIPTMLVSRLARQRVTVALSGDAGDELFGGYGRYFAINSLWSALQRMPAPLRRMTAPLLDVGAMLAGPMAMSKGRISTLPTRLGRLAERMRATDLEMLRRLFIGGHGLQRMSPRRDPAVARAEAAPAMPDSFRALMFADQSDYLPDNILHKVDRASMAYALEARVPFLDHRVVEASWALATSSLIANGSGKKILRTMLARHLPPHLFERPKQGFSPPLDAWLRGPLRAWAEPLLTHDSLRDLPFVDAIAVRDVWASHVDGRRDAGMALWSILMLSDWRRTFGAR